MNSNGSSVDPSHTAPVTSCDAQFRNLIQNNEDMVNGLKFRTFFSCILKQNVGYHGWNSRNACQNNKQGRP